MQMETTATARNSVDVDVGGTFTDLVLIVDGQSFYRKVPTTPYDLSVCFMQVIEKGAQAVGMTLEQLLPKVNIVRYSTTVAMNRLLERKGPRIGLITTEGHEDAILIGRGAQWIDGTRIHERRALPLQNKPAPLVPRELIVGVKERVDGRGAVIRPLDETTFAARSGCSSTGEPVLLPFPCSGPSSNPPTSGGSGRSSARSSVTTTWAISRSSWPATWRLGWASTRVR